MINKSLFKNKTIFITGGTGSFGQHFVKTILENTSPKKIIIYSRDELKQYEMQISEKFNKPSYKNIIRYFIGDVRDQKRLRMAMNSDIDYVIHSAALKQVTTAEYNPFEAVQTNIIGAQNLIEASMDCGIKKVIALSTDKAAAPINLYGATKLTSDKLFISANNYKGKSNIKFSVVRYGNVMGSRGSVIPFFLKNKDNSSLPITDINMTRFNITLNEGVNFVIKCLDNMWGGELFVPKIPSYKIIDVAKAISPKTKFKIVGIRSGEKIHEEMITNADSINTVEFKDYYVILPSSSQIKWKRKDFLNKTSKTKGKMCNKNFSYNSKDNKHYLSIKEIKKLISNNLDSFHIF